MKVEMPVINAAVADVLHEMETAQGPKWESGYGWRCDGDWFLASSDDRKAAYEHQHIFKLLMADIEKAKRVIWLRDIRRHYDMEIDKLMN